MSENPDVILFLKFDSDGKPLPTSRALLRKLLGLKSMKGAPAPTSDPTEEKQESLGIPPHLSKDPDKKPRHFVQRVIPCPGGCGRSVMYRGAGHKPPCTFCGGKAKVVPTPTHIDLDGDNLTKPIPVITSISEVLKAPSPPAVDPPALKRLCKLCEQPLISKYGKFYCPNCSAYRNLPEDQRIETPTP